jgi:hypothetical protein
LPLAIFENDGGSLIITTPRPSDELRSGIGAYYGFRLGDFRQFVNVVGHSQSVPGSQKRHITTSAQIDDTEIGDRAIG